MNKTKKSSAEAEFRNLLDLIEPNLSENIFKFTLGSVKFELLDPDASPLWIELTYPNAALLFHWLKVWGVRD
jgi:hypothetical protein